MNLSQREQLDRIVRDVNDVWDVFFKDLFVIIWVWAVIWLLAYYLL